MDMNLNGFHGFFLFIGLHLFTLYFFFQAALLFLVSVCPSIGQLIGEFDKNALKEAQEAKEKDSKFHIIVCNHFLLDLFLKPNKTFFDIRS